MGNQIRNSIRDRIKIEANFYLDEFIDQETYRQYGRQSIWFLDFRIVRIAQLLRNVSGQPVIINSWFHGGGFNESGFRRPASRTGAYLSQHRFGRAIDPKVNGKDPEEVHELIHFYKAKFMAAGLSTLEHTDFTPTWSHLDCRHTNLEDLLIIKP